MMNINNFEYQVLQCLHKLNGPTSLSVISKMVSMKEKDCEPILDNFIKKKLIHKTATNNPIRYEIIKKKKDEIETLLVDYEYSQQQVNNQSEKKSPEIALIDQILDEGDDYTIYLLNKIRKYLVNVPLNVIYLNVQKIADYINVDHTYCRSLLNIIL